MPMVHMAGPCTERRARRCGRYRIVANLDKLVGMRLNRAPQMLGEHLRAKADAKQRYTLPERNRDPVDLALDEVIGIIGAHRASENDGTSMVGEGGGKLLTQTGTANIEHNTLLAQHDADTAWGRSLRVDNDQYAANHALRSQSDNLSRKTWALQALA